MFPCLPVDVSKVGVQFTTCEKIGICNFSVMESIALGTPVIGSRIGGIPELIEEGRTGDLFCAGDAEELKNKVESLWNEPERLQAYAEGCCKKGFDTVGSYCEKLLEVIRRL